MGRDDGPDDRRLFQRHVAERDGALVVTGEIARGLAFPCAGVIWMPGEQSMRPVDFTGP